MKIASTKARLLSLSILSLGILALLFLNARSISSKNREISELVNQAEDASRKEIANQAIKVIRDSSQEEIEKLESLVLSGNEVVSVIESLESAGKALKLETEIISVNKSEEAPVGEPQKIRIVIEGSGSWDGAYSLLKAVESLPHRVMMEEATLTKEESFWKSRVVFSLYSFN